MDALASLMEEFQLKEASITLDGLHVTFKRTVSQPTALVAQSGDVEPSALADEIHVAPAAPAKPAGIPVTSPISGIFYDTQSPSSPPFVKVGDVVSAGQVVAIIESQKTFNEIPSSVSGTVLEIVATSGSVVQPGDVLIYIG